MFVCLFVLQLSGCTGKWCQIYLILIVLSVLLLVGAYVVIFKWWISIKLVVAVSSKINLNKVLIFYIEFDKSDIG